MQGRSGCVRDEVMRDPNKEIFIFFVYVYI